MIKKPAPKKAAPKKAAPKPTKKAVAPRKAAPKKQVKKPSSFLLADKFEIVPAFTLNGETFYMHKDPLNTACGRGLTAMMLLEELMMRCDAAYLKEYCAAVRAIFSDPRKIEILKLAQITAHLEERVNFLVAVPDQVFKLASVVFFTKEESYFRYDQRLGAERVEQWKNTPEAYDFFLQTPLQTLLPFLALPEQNSVGYLAAQERISDIHYKFLRSVSSETKTSAGQKN